mmetsp:Transcript_23498/g.67721  ORF Transcript_23498/g.67721 Transcript_23498/m.67721 type:complete len:494 (+) Transcript_23498:679-2160(+)
MMIVGGGTKDTGDKDKVLGTKQAPTVALNLELIPAGSRKDDVQIQSGRGVVLIVLFPALALVPDGDGRYDGPGGRGDAQRPTGHAAGEDAELHALLLQNRCMMRRRRPDAEVVGLLRHNLPDGQRLGTEGRRAGDIVISIIVVVIDKARRRLRIVPMGLFRPFLPRVHRGVLLDRLLLQIPLDADPRPPIVGRELIGIDQLLQLGHPLRSVVAQDGNLVHRPGIDPFANELPRHGEESRRVDDDQMAERFGEAEGIDLRLGLDDVQRPLGQVAGRQSVQIDDADHLIPLEVGVGQPLPIQLADVAVHHVVPVVVQDAVHRRDARHALGVELPHPGNEERMSTSGVAVVHLGILGVVDGGFDAEGQVSIGIEVGTAGPRPDGGGLGDHCDGLRQMEFARPEPPAQGVGGILGRGLEAVHGRLELWWASFYLGFELLKYVPLLPGEVAGISPIPYRHGPSPPSDHGRLCRFWYRRPATCAIGLCCPPSWRWRCLG